MKKIGLGLLLASTASLAMADYDDHHCQQYPHSEQISVNAIQKQLVNQGYEIHEFDYENHCYEMEGRNPQGKNIKIYLDSKGKIVHSERDWG